MNNRYISIQQYFIFIMLLAFQTILVKLVALKNNADKGLELHTNMLSPVITQFKSYKIETKVNIFHTIATASVNDQKSLKRQ